MLNILVLPLEGKKNIYKACMAMLITLLVFWQSSIYAQSIVSEITLSTAVKRTLKQNPDLQVFQYRKVSLQGKKKTANLNPKYLMGANIINFGGSNGVNNTASPNFGISLSSIIELGGKRNARVKAVQAGQSKLTIQRKIVALNLIGEVARRFVDVLSMQEKIKVSIKAQDIAIDTLQAVKKRSSAGVTPQVEIKRAEAMLIKAKMTVLLYRKQLLYLKSALSILWGDKFPGFATVQGDLYQFGSEISFKEIYDQAKNNPNIKLFAAEDRLRETELHLTETQSSLDIGWSVALRQYTAIKHPVILAKITVPLFSGQRNAGALESSRAALDEVNVGLKSTLLNLHTQLYHAYQNRQQAILTAQTLQNNIIPLLKESLVQTREYYQKGLYSYLELVAVSTELINARESLVTAATAVLRYNADIEQLTAVPIFSSDINFNIK